MPQWHAIIATHAAQPAPPSAEVAKSVDAGDSKSPAARRAGSSPAFGTTFPHAPYPSVHQGVDARLRGHVLHRLAGTGAFQPARAVAARVGAFPAVAAADLRLPARRCVPPILQHVR